MKYALVNVSQLDSHFIFDNTSSSKLLARNMVHFRLVRVSKRPSPQCLGDGHSQLWNNIPDHVGGGLFKRIFR